MCSVRPLSSSSTWGTNSTIASRDSTAPLGDPGRLTIRTRPRVPASDRESTASGVVWRPQARISSPRPGISRSITDRVASGVTSRGATPVPPVVKMAETWPPSARVARRALISEASSGMASMTETLQPSCSNRSRAAGPERSARAPALTESLMVRTAALVMIPLAAEVSAFAAGLFEQVKILDLDGFVERFEHVVNRECGHRGGGERLHFDAGLRGGGGGGDDAHAFLFDGSLDIRVGEHQRMAERNQLGSALGGGDAGDARDLERVPLGIAGQLLERGGRDAHKGVGARGAARFF